MFLWYTVLAIKMVPYVGKHINLLDDAGMSVLHRAVEANCEEANTIAMEIIPSPSVDLDLVSEMGDTALVMATHLLNVEVGCGRRHMSLQFR